MAILSSVKVKTSDTGTFSDSIPFGTKSDYVSHQNYNLKSIIGDVEKSNLLTSNGSIVAALDALNASVGGDVASAITDDEIETIYKTMTFE